MRNCIILGAGRSGTSMAAGVLRKSGYFMGEKLNPGNETNPKGQFEDLEVNRINEELLAQVTEPRPPGILGKLFFRSRPTFGQRWLARLPLKTSIPCPTRLAERIRLLTGREPFCFKDPRFSYTLGAWRPFVKKAVFLCIFRHPGAVVTSILKQRKKVLHLRDFSINAEQAFKVWELMYSHILEFHYPQGGDWLFMHYDQFLDGSACDRLVRKLSVKVDYDFPEASLNRSQRKTIVTSRILYQYRKLCELAGYEERM